MIAQAVKMTPCQAHNYQGSEDKVLRPTCNLSKGRVFVQGDFANAATYRLFTTRGYEKATSIEDADIVVWTGGEDINPKLYNEQPAGASWWSDSRDSDDISAIERAKGKFLVGICRGAQLLNVIPNGGSLWQDVNNHGGGVHNIHDLITGETIQVNSIHHQQLRLTDKAELVASTNLSTEKYSYAGTWKASVDSSPDPDVEVAWYPHTRSLLFQGHPEFDQNGSTGNYFHRLLERFYHAA